MKNYLDTIRKPVNLPLFQGEVLIKYFTASYELWISQSSSWRLGNLYLTNKRLFFIQGEQILFKIPLNQIQATKVLKRGWILGKQIKQLHILPETGNRIPYIAVKDPDDWKKAIDELRLEQRSISSDEYLENNNILIDIEVIKEPGGYLSPGKLLWKLGTIVLTSTKLSFSQGTTLVWEITLCNIKGFAIEKKVYSVSQTDTIRIEYESDGEPISLWVICQNLDKLYKELSMRLLLKLSRGTVNKVAEGLDKRSAMILWFLYENRHGRIDILSNLIGAENHMDVLIRIKEVINPASESEFGFPILTFEASRVDWETGDKVTFSWWINGLPDSEIRDTLLDIFDEGNNLIIYFELPDLNQETLKLRVLGHQLFIADDIGYLKEISLPALVDKEKITSKIKNNILEVILTKLI
ncbi:MAG: Hsp20/alpha crystallin family protein [Mariniphaga sp.]